MKIPQQRRNTFMGAKDSQFREGENRRSDQTRRDISSNKGQIHDALKHEAEQQKRSDIVHLTNERRQNTEKKVKWDENEKESKQENMGQREGKTERGLSQRMEVEQDVRERAWKSEFFEEEFRTNPKAVLERDYGHLFPGGKIPPELSIKVVEEEEQSMCFVLHTKGHQDILPDKKAIDDESLSNSMDREHRTWNWGTCYTCHRALTCYTCFCK
jgi:hypothetical protein